MATINYIKQYRATGDKKYLKSFYSDASYLSLYAKPKSKWIQKFKIIQKVMCLKAGDKVLDVGCAAKMFKPYVEEMGAAYYGADIAAGFKPDYVCDAESLEGVPSDSFDWVLLSDVLEHLPNPQAALVSARRVGRRVFSVVPNWYRLECIPWLPRDPGDRHLNRMKPSKWLKLHESAGWKVTHFRGFYYVPSIAFYPVLPLRLFDGLIKRSVFNELSRVVDQHWAHKRLIRVSGQELMVVGGR